MKQVVLLLIVACLTGCFGADPEKTGLEGQALKDFSLLRPDSASWANTRNAPTGKAIALFFFSPHCPYCRAQTEEIIEDMDKLKDIQFYFVTNFPISTIKDYYSEYKLSEYSNIAVGLDTSGKVMDYFEASGVPYMAIYGKDRKLRKTYMGKLYSSQIKKAAEQ